MLILAYFAEGVVRGSSNTGVSAQCAWVEVVFALVFSVSTIALFHAGHRAAR